MMRPFYNMTPRIERTDMIWIMNTLISPSPQQICCCPNCIPFHVFVISQILRPIRSNPTLQITQKKKSYPLAAPAQLNVSKLLTQAKNLAAHEVLSPPIEHNRSNTAVRGVNIMGL